MASNLFDMMAELSKDSGKLKAFKEDPEAKLVNAGLTKPQRELILSAINDNKQIDLFKAIGDEMHEQWGEGEGFSC